MEDEKLTEELAALFCVGAPDCVPMKAGSCQSCRNDAARVLGTIDYLGFVVIPRDDADWLLEMAEDRGTTEEQKALAKIRAALPDTAR